MKKKFMGIAVVLAIMMMIAACTSGGGGGGGEVDTGTEPAPPPVVEPDPDTPDDGVVNANLGDYTYIEPVGTSFDLVDYYNSYDASLDCSSVSRSNGGTVRVPDDPTTAMPKAAGDWTVGFSVYNTFDDIGAQILDAMQVAADEAGVALLVNDANYDQNAQNQAIEQWIVQKVDGVILAPCDFHGVKDSLDKLKEAGIPVVTLNAPLAGEADCMVMGDCLEQGYEAGKILVDYYKAEDIEIAGKIVYGILPFVHPNVVLRVAGFMDAFADYPIDYVELTGDTIESHYTSFEGALQAHSDMIGAYGVYDSVTLGYSNAIKAAGKSVPLTSVDNDRLILAGIKEGDILGSACYSATAPSWWCMSSLINLLNGAEIPSVVFYQTISVVPNNVDDIFTHYFPGETVTEYLGME